MARINLEDTFFLEIMGMAVAMGSQDLAIGNAVRFFRYSQERHKLGKYISEEEFKAHSFSEHLFPNFAKRTPDGIAAAGSEKHFGWLAKRVEAGRKGGSQSKPKQKKAKPSKPKQVEPSPSYSSSPSSSCSPSTLIHDVPSEHTKTSDFVAAYCARFKERWQVSALIQGKDAGIAKRLAGSMTLGRFKDLLEAFFQMPDAQLVKWKHPISAFEMKLNEITVFADSGKFTTQREAHQADNTATNAILLDKIQRGEI